MTRHRVGAGLPTERTTRYRSVRISPPSHPLSSPLFPLPPAQVRERLEPLAETGARYTVQLAAAGGGPAVARGGWSDGGAADAQHLLRVEGHCDLRGVPLRCGGGFFLRTVHCVRDGHSSGCHLEADPELEDRARTVRARRLLRGEARVLVAHRPAKVQR